MKENSRHISPKEGISGRRVDFEKDEKISWGIEIDLPLNPPIKERLEKKYGIKIPDQVDKFKYLDLNPQESLPVYLRGWDKGSHIEWRETNLDKLVATNTINKNARLQRRKTIERLFFAVFGRNKEKIEEFNSLLSTSLGDTILVVEGHSREAPWEIGERDPRGPLKRSIREFQRLGNKVSIEEILRKYNNPTAYSAILVVACYDGSRKVRALGVPLAYAIGFTTTGSSYKGLLPTTLIYPTRV